MTPVEWIWAGLLIAILLLLPFVVIGLHRLWAASRSIEAYFSAMAEAGEGIASATSNLEDLQATITVAGKLLSAGGAIHHNCSAIHDLLASRARETGGRKP